MTGPTVADLLRTARRHGFDLTAVSDEFDESGADFLVARAVDGDGARWMLKAPRALDVMVRAEPERRVLALVGRHLPVAIPDWRLFTPEILAHRRLAGEPAAVVDPTRGDWAWRFDATAPPAVFIESLGAMLASLHRVDVEEAKAARLMVVRPDDLRAATAASIEKARDGLKVPEQLWRRWHRWVEDETLWPAEPVLVHGDLHPGHILVGPDARVTGVIDWSEAHVGDPAADFSLLYSSMGRDALVSLLDSYRAAGGHVWPGMTSHVIERWCAYPAVIAEFARMSGDDRPMSLAQDLVDDAVRSMSPVARSLSLP